MSFELFSGVALPNTDENANENDQINQNIEVDNEFKINYKEIILKQRMELLNHIRQLKLKVDSAITQVQKAQEKIDKEGETSKDGITLLQIKNHCLAEYLENIALFCSARATGNDPSAAIEALCTNRTVIEKMKPIERQLQVQFAKWNEVEKHAATKGEILENTSNLRPNLAGMLQSDSSTTSSGMVSANYIPPQIMSTHYPKAKEDALKESRYAKSTKARTHSSVLMDEAAAEYLDTPEEVGRLSAQNRKLLKAYKDEQEIEQWELDNYQRIQRPKKHREMLKELEKARVGGQLDDILKYGHYSGGRKSKDNDNKKH